MEEDLELYFDLGSNYHIIDYINTQPETLRNGIGNIEIAIQYIEKNKNKFVKSIIDETQAMFLFQKIGLNYVSARELVIQIFKAGT